MSTHRGRRKRLKPQTRVGIGLVALVLILGALGSFLLLRSPSSAPAPSSQQQTAPITPSAAPSTLQASSTPSASPAPKPTAHATGLDNPKLKDRVMSLMETAENSTTNWRSTFGYIENIGDGRGFTGGIIGFCSGTGDMVVVVRNYVHGNRGDPRARSLARFLPRLEELERAYNTTGENQSSTAGLGPAFVKAWKHAASDPKFQQAQMNLNDSWYFNEALKEAKADGLHGLGLYIYYDAIVKHGPGSDPDSFGGIRNAAHHMARTPAQGGGEITYLRAFLDARVKVYHREGETNLNRIQVQRSFLKHKLHLQLPLHWVMYGDPFSLP